MLMKLWLLLFLLTFTHAKPVKEKHKASSKKTPSSKASKVQTNVDALKYLDKFGYNKCGGNGNGKVTGGGPLCQSSFQTMLEHFQTIYRLPVTGKLDAATTKLMNQPRCSLGDYPMAYSAFRPWPNATLKWTLLNDIPQFGRDKIRAMIEEAFNDWARYAPLKFREAVGNEKPDFSISFQKGEHDDGYPFDGPGGTLAHGYFPTDGRVHFDSTEEWTDKYDGFGFNFRLVASHEFGHALGLAHSSDPNALMYPFYKIFQPSDLLPKDDRDGIRALYGTSATNIPTTFAPTIAPATKATTKKGVKNTKKTTKHTTKKPSATKAPELSHDRCARYLDVVFGGGPDKWLYTLDYTTVWRYHPDYKIWDTQGFPITEVFPGAEPHMMAGILSPKTNKIYLFKGYRVWRFANQNQLEAGFPKRIFGTGTPFNPIAALYEKGHIWLLKGGLLYKFDEKDLRYEFQQPPKRIDEQFPGVPKSVRAAFTHDGHHYFFTEPDRQVYIFDVKTRKLRPGYPKPMTTGWFACTG